jgi:formamidopyrimidine-DNA glycosylase
MPELPEVETTRRGIAPHLEAHTVSDVIVRQPRLRWPVPRGLKKSLVGQELMLVERRAKYLLLRFPAGTLIIHLGMSGSLRVLPADTPADAHDHVDIVFGHTCLRLRDPRRFGAVLWEKGAIAANPLLAHLGPEPLADAFDTAHLAAAAKGRKVAIKQLIMDGKVVVGVGNIYANEALYMAGINPQRAAGRISRARLARLVAAIKQVLAAAIEQGGTTLRDFQREDGRPGYFAQELLVYGRGGLPCPGCGAPLKEVRLGQRSTVYCGRCQR